MRNLRRYLIAGGGLAALLFVCQVYSGPAETHSRVNRSIPLTAIDWPNVRPIPAATERWYAKDLTPAMRVREAFTQLGESPDVESRGVTRYSSLTVTTQ